MYTQCMTPLVNFLKTGKINLCREVTGAVSFRGLMTGMEHKESFWVASNVQI